MYGRPEALLYSPRCFFLFLRIRAAGRNRLRCCLLHACNLQMAQKHTAFLDVSTSRLEENQLLLHYRWHAIGSQSAG